MTYLDYEAFSQGLSSCEEKDPAGVSLRRKPKETKKEYLKRLDDFEVLVFLLKAKTPEEVRKGIPRGDGTFRKVTIKKVCELFSKAPDLLEGAQDGGLLSKDSLMSNLDSFRESDTGEYLF